MLCKTYHFQEADFDRSSASLTVEAALVMPVFLYMMIAFLYFIQIFTLQEQIQVAITKMGLSLARTSYVYDDFIDVDEVQAFDQSVFGVELDLGLQELTKSIMNENLLKLYVMKYLDVNQVNRSCIKKGFEGLSFKGSSALNEEGFIDIIVRYQIQIPVRIFALDDMRMIQRVKLRSWTGYEVPACYTMTDENDKVEIP